MRCDLQPRVQKAVVLLVTALQASTAAAQAPPQQEVIEEFDIANDGDAILVPVTVAGTKRLLAVDTGATDVFYDISLQRSLRPRGQVASAGTASGRRVQVHLFDAPAALLGRLDLRGREPANAPPVVGLDLGGLRAAITEDVRGLIGCCFLRDYVIRLDVEAGKLSFLRHVGAEPGVRVAMEFVYGLPAVNCRLAGAGNTLFILDTGSVGPSGGLDIATVKKLDSMHLLTRLPNSETIELDSVRRLRRLTRVQSITVGGFTHNELVFGEEEGDLSMCRLGLAYLSRYVVTFDFPGGAVYLKPNRNFSAVDTSNLSGSKRAGVSLGREDGAVFVADVSPQSPANKAGVRARDVIISVDGKDVHGSRPFSIGKQFLSCGDTAQLTVRRGNRTISLTLRLPPAATDSEASTEP